MRNKTCLSLLLLCSTGCGAQATGGVGIVDGHSLATTSMLLTMHAMRESSPVLGVRSSAVIDQGIALKNVNLHAGYDLLICPGYFALEGGGDLGGGQPGSSPYSGFGAYVGGAGNARLRLSPGGDREATFNLAFPMIELVLAPRAGWWSPPEGSSRTDLAFEYAFELGLRFAIGSDLVNPTLGRKADGENPKPAAPGAR